MPTEYRKYLNNKNSLLLLQEAVAVILMFESNKTVLFYRI